MSRSIKRSIARAYARELGMQHPNKRRTAEKTTNLHGVMRTFTIRDKSRFGDFYARLTGGALPIGVEKVIQRIESRRDKAQAAAHKIAVERHVARNMRLNLKAERFPAACGARYHQTTLHKIIYTACVLSIGISIGIIITLKAVGFA